MGEGVRMGVVWETERENGRWDSIKDGRRGRGGETGLRKDGKDFLY